MAQERCAHTSLMFKWLFGGDEELSALERAVTSKPGHLVGNTWTAPGTELRVDMRVLGSSGTLLLTTEATQVSVMHDPTPNPVRPLVLPAPVHLDGWDDAGKKNTSSEEQRYLVYSFVELFRGAGAFVCGTAAVSPITEVMKSTEDACVLFVRCKNPTGTARVNLDYVDAAVKAHPAASFVEAAWSDKTLVLAISIRMLSADEQAALFEKVRLISRKRSREDDDDDRALKRFRASS